MQHLIDPMRKAKGGPFIGPRGGKWADAKHTIPWKEGSKKKPAKKKAKKDTVGQFDLDALAKLSPKDRDLLHQYIEVNDSEAFEMTQGGEEWTLEEHHGYEYPTLIKRGWVGRAMKEIKSVGAAGIKARHATVEAGLERYHDAYDADGYWVDFDRNEFHISYQDGTEGVVKKTGAFISEDRTGSSIYDHDWNKLLAESPHIWDKDKAKVKAYIEKQGYTQSDIETIGEYMSHPEVTGEPPRGKEDEVEVGLMQISYAPLEENVEPYDKKTIKKMRRQVDKWNKAGLKKSEDKMSDLDPIEQLGELSKAADGGIPQAEAQKQGRSRRYFGPRGGVYSDPGRKRGAKKEKPLHQQTSSMGRDLGSSAMLGKLKAKMMAGKASSEDVARYLTATRGKKKKQQVFTGPKGGRYADSQHKTPLHQQAHGISMGLKSMDGMEPREIDPNTLSKGMHSFYLSGSRGTTAVPDKYLAEYVDSFIEEAWEHERREHAHTDPNLVAHSNDLTGYFSGCVYRELIAFIPHNPSLKKACTKLGVTKEYVDERLRAMNLMHVDSENQNANQKASTSGYHPTPLALSQDESDASNGAQFLGEKEIRDEMRKSFQVRSSPSVELAPGPDPMELLNDRLAESPFRAGGVAESESDSQ